MMGSLQYLIDFSKTEGDEILEQDTVQEEADLLMQTIRQGMSIASDGWISNESYNAGMDWLMGMKKDALSKAGTEFEHRMIMEHWPFDDYDEEE